MRWPSCRWCARFCSHRWASSSATSRCRRSSKTGEEGRGLAVAGLVISYLITVLTILVVVLSVLFIVQVARDLESLDGLTPGLPGHHGDPVAAGRQQPAAVRPAEDAGLQLPISGDDGTGEQARQAAAGRPDRRPIPAVIRAGITTSQGSIGLELDNGKTPCTVNNFTSLAKQGFFDNTNCHRLTTSAELGVLQCGDPTGSGTGGRVTGSRTSTRPTSSG